MKILSRATERLLSPVGIAANDRLRIQLEKSGKKFIVTPYAVKEMATLVTDDENVESTQQLMAKALNSDGGEATVRVERKERHVYASNAARVKWFERVPERKQLTTWEGTFQQWELAATDFTAAVIEGLWPANQLVIDDDARIVYEYLLNTIRVLDLNAEDYATWDATGNIPSTAAALEAHTDPDLKPAPYQRLACLMSMRSEGFCLDMEQGTGKTPIVILRVCNEAPRISEKLGRMYRCLVVAPKNVRSQWVEEFNRFTTRKGKVEAVRGGPVQRFKSFVNSMVPSDGDECYTVLVVSWEAISRMQELYSVEWDLIVWDESHFAKSPNTDRYKSSVKLRDCGTRRMTLSGTSIVNTFADKWSQFEMCREGSSGFMAHPNFKDFYGVYKPTGEGFEKLIGYQNLPFLKERFARQCFIISKKRAMPDLPDKLPDIYEVEMSARQKEVYLELRNNLMVEIENDIAGAQNMAIVAQNVLTKLLRLAQITAGFAVWSKFADIENPEACKEKGQIEEFHPNPKMEALVEILKGKTPLQKTIVWTNWVPNLKSIHTRLEAEGIDHVMFYGSTSDRDREEAKRRFNWDPDCRVFVGNQAAGGVGLNLLGYPPGETHVETNCDHVIYFSQRWQPAERWQSEDRANRRGTRVPTRVTDLVVPGTVDEQIRARVLDKRGMTMEMNDIRTILRNVLTGVIGDD